MDSEPIGSVRHSEGSSLLSPTTGVACCDSISTLAIVTLESEAIEDEDGVNEDGVDGIDGDDVDDDVGDMGITGGSGVGGESLTRAEFTMEASPVVWYDSAEFATCACEGSST